jgi:hypothetical protein
VTLPKSKLVTAIKMRFRGLGQKAKLGFLLLAIIFFNIVGLLLPLQSGATGGNMILFWDPANGGAPTGWCLLGIYNGFFPRGDTVSNTVANWGTTFSTPSRPYTPTNASVTIGAASATTGSGGGTGESANTHTSTGGNVTYSSDDNGDATTNPDLPAFRSLELIEYGTSAGGGTCTGSGIPNVIPSGAIALFNTAIPATGWTRVSAQDGKILRVNSTVATGGGDTEANNVTVSGISGSTGASSPNPFLLNGNAAITNHTHAPPATLTCTSGCTSTSCPLQGTAGSTGTSTSTFTCTSANTDPPYVQPLLAEANANTSTLSIDITAMFDNDPGNGWVVISNGGGSYNGKFVRPNSTVNLGTLGNATRASETFTGTTGNNLGGTVSTLALGGTAAASPHNHTITAVTNTTTNSNIPPYFEVIFAEKVSFTLQHYEWYVDSGAQDVTDPWPSGSLNVAEDTAVPAIPAPYLPPDIGTQLRLRVQILVSGQNMAANSTAFKLQYANTTVTDCINGGTGGWNDVDVGGSGSGAWRYGTTSLADSTALGTSRLSPTSTVLEFFSKSASGAITTNPATSGQTIEYDWLIQNNAANSGSQYTFRPIETSGTLLGEYNGENPLTSKCPTLVTMPGVGQEMRHGEFFQDGSDQGFEWAN